MPSTTLREFLDLQIASRVALVPAKEKPPLKEPLMSQIKKRSSWLRGRTRTAVPFEVQVENVGSLFPYYRKCYSMSCSC